MYIKIELSVLLNPEGISIWIPGKPWISPAVPIVFSGVFQIVWTPSLQFKVVGVKGRKGKPAFQSSVPNVWSVGQAGVMSSK